MNFPDEAPKRWQQMVIGVGLIWRCVALVILSVSVIRAPAQNKWTDAEIDGIFDGVQIDIAPALEDIQIQGVSPFDFGRALLKAGQTVEAKNWFDTLTLANDDHAARFGLAWLEWQNGNEHGAQMSAYALLDLSPQPLIKARVLYLLGSVNLKLGKTEKARIQFSQALEAYEKLERAGGQVLALTGLARVAIVLGEYKRVEPLLERACEINQDLASKGREAISLGRYHEVIAELEEARGRLGAADRALDHSQWLYRTDLEIALADRLEVQLERSSTGRKAAAGGKGCSHSTANSRDEQALDITVGPCPGDENGS